MRDFFIAVARALKANKPACLDSVRCSELQITRVLPDKLVNQSRMVLACRRRGQASLSPSSLFTCLNLLARQQYLFLSLK